MIAYWSLKLYCSKAVALHPFQSWLSIEWVDSVDRPYDSKSKRKQSKSLFIWQPLWGVLGGFLLFLATDIFKVLRDNCLRLPEKVKNSVENDSVNTGGIPMAQNAKLFNFKTSRSPLSRNEDKMLSFTGAKAKLHSASTQIRFLVH